LVSLGSTKASFGSCHGCLPVSVEANKLRGRTALPDRTRLSDRSEGLAQRLPSAETPNRTYRLFI
jgi:hypothetical protein